MASFAELQRQLSALRESMDPPEPRLPALPTVDDSPVTALDWGMFDAAKKHWVKVAVTAEAAVSPPVIVEREDVEGSAGGKDKDKPDDNNNQNKGTDTVDATKRLLLISWNTDAFGYEHAARLQAILGATQTAAAATTRDDSTPDPDAVADIILLQEVSGIGKYTLFTDAWIRANYFISGLDWMMRDVNSPFYNVTLLSRRRFSAEPSTVPSMLTLGPVWMVRFPSRYGRYALCCDVTAGGATFRLANVHLDSLARRPSKRPRQLEVVAGMLKCEGLAGGLVGGDFNPVLPEEDDGLVQANGLVDCWQVLHGEDQDDGNDDGKDGPSSRGFTWGVDGEQVYPPIRMDKVAITDRCTLLRPRAMYVTHPKTVAMEVPTKADGVAATSEPPQVPWSDHSGLVVTFCVGE